MSLIITTYIREGIVLSSDSRLSISHKVLGIKNITQSNAVRKTFVTSNSVGISSCGAADINGVPIAGFIDSFISEEIADNDYTVEEVTDLLMEYFRKIDNNLLTFFHVAGYDNNMVGNKTVKSQKLYRIHVKNNSKEDIIKNKIVQGSIFNGYPHVLAKLLNPVYIKNNDGKPDSFIPFNGIAWSFLNMQDAIDFNRFGTQTTIDAMRFETIDKTVGGPIDILVISPVNHYWVQKKNLK